jgi:hypothetical protein
VDVGGNAGKDLKMKKLFSWKSAAVLPVLVVLLAAPAAAQTPAVRADVPFAFTVADQTFPAGVYRFSVDLDHMLVVIREERGLGIWLARLVPGDSSRPLRDTEKGLLRFYKYGDRHVLNGIWRAGSAQGNAVTPSRLPRELAKTRSVRDVPATR